jgi:hypothetical protein
MTLRDVMTKEEHSVTERGASRGMQAGDLLFGQLATVDGLTMLEAFSGFAIPPMEKASIIELRTRIASAHPAITHQVLRDRDIELLDLFHEIADRLFNPRLPILQNTDGELLSHAVPLARLVARHEIAQRRDVRQRRGAHSAGHRERAQFAGPYVLD